MGSNFSFAEHSLPTTTSPPSADVVRAAQQPVTVQGIAATDLAPSVSQQQQVQVLPGTQPFVYRGTTQTTSPTSDYKMIVTQSRNGMDRPSMNISFPAFKGQMVMDVENGSKAEGAKVILWPRTKGKNQELLVMTDSNSKMGGQTAVAGIDHEYLYFQFAHSGLYLAVDANNGLIQSATPAKFTVVPFGFGVMLWTIASAGGRPREHMVNAKGKGDQITLLPETDIPPVTAGIMALTASDGVFSLGQVPKLCADNWGTVALVGAGLAAVGCVGYYYGKRSANTKLV
jgi:hypothetical protein